MPKRQIQNARPTQKLWTLLHEGEEQMMSVGLSCSFCMHSFQDALLRNSAACHEEVRSSKSQAADAAQVVHMGGRR